MVSTYVFLRGLKMGENPSTPDWTTPQEEEGKKKKKSYGVQPINLIIITRVIYWMHQLSPPLPQAWKLSD